MSSILDAVTKDSARSGGVPGGASVPSPGSGGGPSRYRAAALVVVFGVAAGALAARMFGGSAELPPDDMLTEKVERRATAKAESGEAAAPVARGEAAAPVAAGEADEPARASRKDENAHQRFLAKKKEAAAAKPPTPEATPPAAPASATPSADSVVAAPAAAPAAVESASPDSAPPVVVATAPVVVASPATSPPIVAGTPVPPPAASVTPPVAVNAPDVAGAPPAIVAGTPAPPSGAAPPPVGAPVVVTAPAVVEPPVVNEPAIDAAGSPPATLENGSEDAGDAAAVAAAEVSGDRPSGAPEVSILFVAWSREPAERVASVRVAAGSLSVVHEGEYVEGLQISAIHPEAVDLSWTGQKYRVAVNPF